MNSFKSLIKLKFNTFCAFIMTFPTVLKAALTAALSVAVILISFNTHAVEEVYPFSDPQKKADFESLVQDLRCPKCQNQNLADSNSMISIDMKNKTYQLLQAGKTKEEVIDFWVGRYTQYVYYDPPINAATIWLWIIPFLVMVFLIWFVLKRNRQSANIHNQSPITDPHLREADAIFAQLEQQAKIKNNTSDTPLNKIEAEQEKNK